MAGTHSAPTPLWLEVYALELPFDTGLPDNFVIHHKDDPAAAVEPGWESFDLADFLQISPAPATTQMQSVTLSFRNATVPGPDPLAALDSAWPAVLSNSRLANPRWKRAYFRSACYRLQRRWSQPPPVTRTVVLATRINHPPASEVDLIQGTWRGQQLNSVLRVLNEYLTALAPMSDNLAVGPITATELPPLLFGYRIRLPHGLASLDQPYEHFALVLHERLMSNTTPLTWAQADHARAVSALTDAPLKTPIDWMHNARRSLLRENHSYAVLESGTAVELAVSEVARRCGPIAGYDAQKLSNVLEGAFASRVKDHFAVLLGFSRDPPSSQDELGAWWRAGYLMRNQVAHRGHRPTGPEASAAVGSADVLLDAAIDRIYQDARFRGLLPGPGPTSP